LRKKGRACADSAFFFTDPTGLGLRITGWRGAQDAFNRFIILRGFFQLVILNDRRERRISLLSGVWPEQILRGVYPELILRFTQEEILRVAQDDRKAKDSG